MSRKWISLKKPNENLVNANTRKFKSNDDFFKSRSMRIENAKRSKISTDAKAVYLLGIARLCNAEKLLSRGNHMTGYKIRA